MTTSRKPSRPKRFRRQSIVIFPLVGAILLFLGPALGFLAGSRAEPIDNRPLTSFPSIHEGWQFFPKLQAWANDYLPLRAQAVKADTKISESLFNEPARFANGGDSVGVAGIAAAPSTSPSANSGVVYPQVLEGKDGWLFYGSDVEAPCKPMESLATIRDGFQQLSDAANQSGRRLVIVIAPDKSSAHPELMPDTYAGKTCMIAQKKAFWKTLGTVTGSTVINPKAAINTFESQTGNSAWRKLDTHWAPEGAAVFATELISKLEPSLLHSTTVVTGATEHVSGDLAAIAGDPRSEPVVSVTVQRPGVSMYSSDHKRITADTTPDLGYTPTTITATTTDAPLYTPKTLVIGDSFFETSRSELAPFFSSLTYVHNMSGDIAGENATLGAQVASSDTIVYELVERAASGGYVSYQHPANYQALAAAMLSHPRN